MLLAVLSLPFTAEFEFPLGKMELVSTAKYKRSKFLRILIISHEMFAKRKYQNNKFKQTISSAQVNVPLIRISASFRWRDNVLMVFSAAACSCS